MIFATTWITAAMVASCVVSAQPTLDVPMEWPSPGEGCYSPIYDVSVHFPEATPACTAWVVSRDAGTCLLSLPSCTMAPGGGDCGVPFWWQFDIATPPGLGDITFFTFDEAGAAMLDVGEP